MGLTEWFIVTSIACLILITGLVSRKLYQLTRQIERQTQEVREKTQKIKTLIR